MVKETLKEILPDAVVSPLEGTYLLWIDLRKCLEVNTYKEIIQKKCGLAVDFGDWFGGEEYNGFIRMNLATSPENVKRGLACLSHLN